MNEAQLSGAGEDARVAAELRAALAQVGAAAVLSMPTEHADLLEAIVQTVQQVLGANAATLYEVDEAANELVFAVTLGDHAMPLHGQRLPMGRGVAGWVAQTGQALAITNLEQDPRWASDIGQRIGYTPNSMLTVPLLLEDRVAGVLQLMDKANGEPFSSADMRTVGLFVRQASVAIAQSHALHSLTTLMRLVLTDAGAPADVVGRAEQSVARAENSPEHREILQLASLVAEVANAGDANRQLAMDVLEGIRRFTTARRGR